VAKEYYVTYYQPFFYVYEKRKFWPDKVIHSVSTSFAGRDWASESCKDILKRLKELNESN
jgi:hypothetical protein